MFEVIHQLTCQEQHEVVVACRQIIAEAPLFTKTMPSGAAFRYRCTSAGDYGWTSDRKGFRYVNHHPQTRNHFPPIPTLIHRIAVDAAASCGLTMRPESALINWYGPDGKLGLHQDKTEVSRAPVVSISLGDDCVFLVGGPRRTDAKEEIILKSGDVLVMGAEHRLCFHGVRKIVAGTAPAGLDVDGRLNVTIRQVYP